ncbi:metal ABC transporter solute-binding protein, Zn/Mn family [Sinorhizobium meliloti]|uniref:ABC transporter substrate-binding protein n=1 Tax=Rhizobium meliloti TaxID=382 RepID=A0A2J0YU11_RHIML|nr:zinc ABC transporter substrate-binding protein [Sinorhizobium meliloti]PJR09899.1 hypothetical protein CEJ86_30260 [Sinorhizobium meliloti]
MSMRVLTLLLATLLGVAVSSARGEDQKPLLVVTGLQATWSITSALVEGTVIKVQNLPEKPASMATLARLIQRVEPARLAQADAVVTIGSVWPQDPLFSAVRAQNIRVVEIDAATPLSGHRSGVGLLRAPQSNPSWRHASPSTNAAPAPTVWMSFTNGIRMAEIVAADLSLLSPPDAEKIAANLDTFRAEMRELAIKADDQLADVTQGTVYALSDKFVYLLNDLSLFAPEHFLEQDLRWTAEDRVGYTEALRASGIKTVVHEWQPDAAITAATEAAGARILVLDPINPGTGKPDPRGYQRLLAANIDALAHALK